MKRITRLISVALLAVFIIVGVFGCYGNMSLTKKVYNFNGSLGNKYVQSIVNWAFWICPVYEISMFLDYVLFNTIEFWTGSNPLAMNEGEHVIKYAESPNGEYKFEISQNQIIISQPANSTNKEDIVLTFDPVNNSWFMNSDGVSQQIGYLEGDQLKLVSPSGEELSINLAK
ncbi:MAG: DUF3332 family protein [Prolixibacteraceae bacterium]|nr:DUF3332 family protein [Prolixibacteraceae bacterium]